MASNRWRIASKSGDPYVLPTKETVLANEYKPLSRPLFIYPDVGKAKTRPDRAVGDDEAVGARLQLRHLLAAELHRDRMTGADRSDDLGRCGEDRAAERQRRRYENRGERCECSA